MSGLACSPAPERVRIMTISKAVDLYLGELARLGRSPRTIDRYRRFLDKLADMYVHIDVEEITSPMVRRFLDDFRFNRKKHGLIPNSVATTAQIASIIRAFFHWLDDEEYIKRDPAERIKRPKVAPAHENDNVLSISTEDVRVLLLEAARSSSWTDRIAVPLAVYTGARRHALAMIRRRDYDPFAGTLRFAEKGGKIIEKPVAAKLAAILDAAIFANVYQSEDDYLVPAKAEQRREGDRDDRIIWKSVKTVAGRCGVETHVHALRAAFAVFYLESKGDDHLLPLKDLMGHQRLETTMIYLRRLDRKRGMETVRDLDWDGPEVFEALPVTEKEGFEPSFPEPPLVEREGTPSDGGVDS
jgi:site-specific recombinase XerC